eukprot:5542835-Prymnesium_polylepis.1
MASRASTSASVVQRDSSVWMWSGPSITALRAAEQHCAMSHRSRKSIGCSTTSSSAVDASVISPRVDGGSLGIALGPAGNTPLPTEL